MDFFKQYKNQLIGYSTRIFIVYSVLSVFRDFDSWENYFFRLFIFVIFIAIVCWPLTRLTKYFYEEGKKNRQW